MALRATDLMRSKYIRTAAMLFFFYALIRQLTVFHREDDRVETVLESSPADAHASPLQQQQQQQPHVSTLPPFLLVDSTRPPKHLGDETDLSLRTTTLDEGGATVRRNHALSRPKDASMSAFRKPLGWVTVPSPEDVRVVYSGASLPAIPSAVPLPALTDILMELFVVYPTPPHVLTYRVAPVEDASQSQRLFNINKILQIYIVGHRRSMLLYVGNLIENCFPNVRVEYVSNMPPCDDLQLGCSKFLHMRRTGKIIHVMSDIRNTLVSLYLHDRSRNRLASPFMSFSQYLRQNRTAEAVVRDFGGLPQRLRHTEYLRYHLQSWLTQYEDVYHLLAENLYYNAKDVLRYLSAFLERPYSPLNLQGVGEVGDYYDTSHPKFDGDRWRSFFTEDDELFLADLMQRPSSVPIPFLQCDEAGLNPLVLSVYHAAAHIAKENKSSATTT